MSFPNQPEGNVFINKTSKIVKKQKKKDGPCIEVAPGEDRELSLWWRKPNFDSDTFFWLHFDGSNGADQERMIKLTKVRYYGQRTTHVNSQWAEDPSYIFVAQQHLEKLRVERQISLTLDKGRLKPNSSNAIPFAETTSIFKDIPGTPNYWRKFRNELLARIEQLGPFHFFFTLSCNERKWMEVITSLLRNKGHTIRFEFEPNDGKFG